MLLSGFEQELLTIARVDVNGKIVTRQDIAVSPAYPLTMYDVVHRGPDAVVAWMKSGGPLMLAARHAVDRSHGRAQKRCAAVSIRPGFVRRLVRGREQEPLTRRMPMRFMVIVKATKESEGGALPDEKALAAMGNFNEELVKAGVMLAGEGLHPSSEGVRISFTGGKKTVMEGPFAETKELVAGYWLLQTKTRAEVVEWIKRAPFMAGEEVEIRQVFEAEEFAASDPTGKVREQEQRLRAHDRLALLTPSVSQRAGDGSFSRRPGGCRFLPRVASDRRRAR